MATQILMPALSPTMTEGKLARWLKKEGDAVKSGDVIAEIETDKATMEVEAVDEGTISAILVPEGTEGVAVNAPIAELDGGAGDAAGAGAGAAAWPSPFSTAIGVFTATPSVPSSIRICDSLPSSTASTSMVALSVSISAMTSPARTSSPTFFSHRASLPSVIVGDSAGISICVDKA